MNASTLNNLSERLKRCQELAAKTDDLEAVASLRALADTLQDEIVRLQAKSTNALRAQRRRRK